mmetsp:Transcript_1911/g.2550  ORF Transcript_1911/g.2550 Transcript_1911/m.2550 type:complete len:80 (+) Transcript_1911:951-1190(+)
MRDTLVSPIEAKLTYPTITAQDFLSIFPSEHCLLELSIGRRQKMEKAANGFVVIWKCEISFFLQLLQIIIVFSAWKVYP